jgi:hypothetical protein
MEKHAQSDTRARMAVRDWRHARNPQPSPHDSVLIILNNPASYCLKMMGTERWGVDGVAARSRHTESGANDAAPIAKFRFRAIAKRVFPFESNKSCSGACE